MGGSPKGLEQVGGRRIIDRVVSALKTVTPDVVLSANTVDARSWLFDVAVMADKIAGMGGISGIHAALSQGRDALVVAWDMPFVTGDLLKAIVATAAETDADAVVPRSQSRHGVEPFCAWYSRQAFPAVDEFLKEGGGSARDLLSRFSRVHFIPVTVISRIGDPRLLFMSVNTAAGLTAARTIADEAQ